MSRSPHTVVFTVVFQKIRIYLDDYFSSLSSQSFHDFDVLIVNDGLVDINAIINKYANLNISVHSFSGTAAENRQHGFFLIQSSSKYKYIIFADADDYLSENRIELSVKLLQDTDIVVNDVTLVNDTGTILDEMYFSNRIQDKQMISSDFICDKNILGLSNTSIKFDLIKDFFFPKEIIAADWFFFANMLMRKYSCIFTNKTVTFYRQHTENIVGIGKTPSLQYISKGLLTKARHYYYLSKIDSHFYSLFKKYNKMKKRFFGSLAFRQKAIEIISSQKKESPFFWWEDLNLLEDLCK